MPEYKAFFRRVPDLTQREREDMTRLYLTYYDASNAELVLSDLEKKTEALLVNFGETLIGFTTSQVYEREWQDTPIRVLYSGDTIVDRMHWGQQALAFAWIGRLGELRRERPDLPLYWFVIIKGHRTYKFLPTFGKSFFPHWAIDRSDLKPLADALAFDKFGADYNPATGIVEFPESRGHLKDEIALPTEEEKAKDAVKFFVQKNPNYLRGHELVCLCEITEENMKPLTKRIYLRAFNA